MNYKEYIFWFSIGDSIVKHPIITREKKDNTYSYYLFDRIKIYTKKINNINKHKILIKDDCKISVIVPVYNVEKYLERCLDSLINQTLKEIEIICVNDGSTDNSLSILEKYASVDKRIKIINQKNSGPSYTRNNAVLLAKGEYISYIDSDDWVSNNFLELLYNNAIKYNADISCGEIIRVTSNSFKNFLKFKSIRTYYKTEQKYRACKIPKLNYIWNKIYKKESLLNSNIKFEEDVVFEDLLWTHKVIDKLQKLVTVPNAEYFYYMNPKSITTTTDTNEQYMKDYYIANSKCVEYLVRNRIKISDYKAYKPRYRIRINFLGVRIIDFLFWKSLKVFILLGFPILKVFVNNNFSQDKKD